MTTAVRSDKTLWYWGRVDYNNSQLVPIQIGSDNDWKKVHTSYNVVLALKTDGTLWEGSFGNNLTQIGTDNDWNYIWTSQNEWFGIKNNGTLWNDGVQVGTDTDWNSIIGDNDYGAYNNNYAIADKCITLLACLIPPLVRDCIAFLHSLQAFLTKHLRQCFLNKAKKI